jgi:O-antigen ligase
VGYGKFGFAAGAYVLLFAACAVLDNLAPAFLVTAVISIVLLLAGIAYFPRFLSGVKVAIPNAQEDGSHSVTFAEADIPLRPYVQVAICTLSPRHIPELAACGIICIATIVVVTSGVASYRSLLLGWGLFALEGACMAGAGVLLLCLRWADECRMLRRSHATLAPVTAVQSSMAHQHLTYEFADSAGVRFGGYTRVFGEQAQNAVIVFFDPSNPDENRAHCSLNFHRIQVRSIEALKLVRSPTDESAL